MLDVPIKDWHLFLNVANIQVIGVGAATPYQNVGQLLDAMKAKPGEIKVATAGVTSAGHNAMEAISRATGVKYRTSPTTAATPRWWRRCRARPTSHAARGRAGRDDPRQAHRPLATVSDQAAGARGLRRDRAAQQDAGGVSRCRPTTSASSCQGRAGRGGQDAREDLGREHRQERRAEEVRGQPRALFAPSAGAAAQAAVFPRCRPTSGCCHAGGKTKVAPDTVGIPKP